MQLTLCYFTNWMIGKVKGKCMSNFPRLFFFFPKVRRKAQQDAIFWSGNFPPGLKGKWSITGDPRLLPEKKKKVGGGQAAGTWVSRENGSQFTFTDWPRAVFSGGFPQPGLSPHLSNRKLDFFKIEMEKVAEHLKGHLQIWCLAFFFFFMGLWSIFRWINNTDHRWTTS